jgi:hypothetical protein
MEQRFIHVPGSFRLIAALNGLLRAFQIDMQRHITFRRPSLFLLPAPGGAPRGIPRSTLCKE